MNLSLQNERKERVLPEPSLFEPHTVISVRHPAVGTARRIFSSISTFFNVYDLVGSLSTYPMHFSILDRSGKKIQASTLTSDYGRQVLNIEERESPIQMVEKSLINENEVEDVFQYADEDIPEDEHFVLEHLYPILKENQCQCQLVEYLKIHSCATRENAIRKVVAHRRPSSFWRVIFKQNLDASNPFKVIWAGKTSVDEGGPYREFLLRSMDFRLLVSHFFGAPDEMLFLSLTNPILNKEYFLLGQLAVLAILNIGRGPHCIHPSIVDEIFSMFLS